MEWRLNPKQIWQAALTDLEARVSRASFETWFRHLTAVSFDGRELVVAAPSTFAREWLETRHLSEVTGAVSRVVGQTVAVRVVVAAGAGAAVPEPVENVGQPAAPAEEAPTKRRRGRAAGKPAADPALSAKEGAFRPGEVTDDGRPVIAFAARSAETASDDGSETSPDDGFGRSGGGFGAAGWQPSPRYTFATFVVGQSNQLAHAASLSVAEQPGAAYNPLFIYGGVGLGKTHLMHAIAHVALASGHHPLYVTSEEFTNALIAAIRDRRTEEFRNRYRGNDLLLVDDVQFIAGKDATQEEFFHTFNAIHSKGGQIVLSSDRTPRAIPTLEDRLRSRFEWGLIADIQPPDLETRVAILQRKAAQQSLPVPADVIALLAQRIQSNIRELEGSLNRVIAHSQLSGRALNVETAGAALNELLANAARRFIGPPQVIDAVCRYYRVDGRALRGKARDRDIMLPRQVAMYLMREETQASLLDIGRELGGRDHSTVLHGVGKMHGEIEVNAQLRRDVLAIRELLYSEARP